MVRKVRQTAVHPSGKVLRTGDTVHAGPFECEFVGVYGGMIIVMDKASRMIVGQSDWDHVRVEDVPVPDDIAGQLFEI